jgi:hypothetical protein
MGLNRFGAVFHKLFSQAKVLRQLRARVLSAGLAISDLNSFQTFCR